MIRRGRAYLEPRTEPAPPESVQLEREGFADIRGLLSAAEVAALREEISAVFDRDPPDDRGPRTAEDAAMFRYAMLNRSAAAQAAVAHPRLLSVLEPLLGEDCHVIANTAWRNPAGHPGSHGGQNWHIDAGPHIPLPEGVRWPADIPHPVFAVGVHLYLQDCALEDGPTGVIPGSHLSGRPPPGSRSHDDDLDYEGQKVVPLITRAGDAGLFVSDVWHRRMPTKDGDHGRFFLQAQSNSAATSTLETGTLSSRLVPGPVSYTVLRPPGSVDLRGLPLLLLLHGGDGDNGFLANMRRVLDAAWAGSDLPPCLVATPDARRSLYLDYHDGSERWESFIVGEFIPHLRTTYALSTERRGTEVSGISMGGLGALRLGLKHLDVFGGLAALEPGIEPALRFSDVRPRNSFQRALPFLEARYGAPIDAAFWAANNPANLAIDRRDAIIESGLQIYFEAGDQDMFHLDEGAEFLHRVMWDHGLLHEYRVVRGADHLGRTLAPRLRDAGGRGRRRVFEPARRSRPRTP